MDYDATDETSGDGDGDLIPVLPVRPVKPKVRPQEEETEFTTRHDHDRGEATSFKPVEFTIEHQYPVTDGRLTVIFLPANFFFITYFSPGHRSLVFFADTPSLIFIIIIIFFPLRTPSGSQIKFRTNPCTIDTIYDGPIIGLNQSCASQFALYFKNTVVVVQWDFKHFVGPQHFCGFTTGVWTHRFTYPRGVHSYRYFLQPMRTPNLLMPIFILHNFGCYLLMHVCIFIVIRPVCVHYGVPIGCLIAILRQNAYMDEQIT